MAGLARVLSATLDSSAFSSMKKEKSLSPNTVISLLAKQQFAALTAKSAMTLQVIILTYRSVKLSKVKESTIFLKNYSMSVPQTH